MKSMAKKFAHTSEKVIDPLFNFSLNVPRHCQNDWFVI